MKLYDAIKEMRRLSREKISFSFSFMSYNSTKGSTHGVVYVKNARLLKRESKRHNRFAEDMEKYMDLDTLQAKRFWQPLLMSFNGEKITV